MFIKKVAGSEMIQINDKDTAEKFTPQVNNAKQTKTNSTLHKKMIFK